MKVSIDLDVSAERFFTHLIEQIKMDIQATGNEQPSTLVELDGYRYSRFLKRKNKTPFEIRMQIGPLIENQYYEVKYETPTASCRYFYDIRKKNDDSIQVTYVENNNAEGIVNNWFYKTKVKLCEKKLRFRIQKTLKTMEQQILREK